MRTYYFAAESKDAMLQWMNAMSLASIGEQEQDFSKGRLGYVSPNGGMLLFHGYVTFFIVLHTVSAPSLSAVNNQKLLS